MRENCTYGLTRGSGKSLMVEILWHRRETSRQTEKTNLNLMMINLTLLYREIKRNLKMSQNSERKNIKIHESAYVDYESIQGDPSTPLRFAQDDSALFRNWAAFKFSR